MRNYKFPEPLRNIIPEEMHYSGTAIEYILPETHKRIYNTSLTNLPLELGGQIKN